MRILACVEAVIIEFLLALVVCLAKCPEGSPLFVFEIVMVMAWFVFTLVFVIESVISE